MGNFYYGTSTVRATLALSLQVSQSLSSMIRSIISAFALFVLTTGTFSCAQKLQITSPTEAEERLQHLLTDYVEVKKGAPGAMLHVESPTLSLSWSGSAGVSNISTNAPLAPDQTFRLASVTKTYVAAAILRLVEDGQLSLETTIDKLVSANHLELIRQDGYQPEKIKLAHLLNHTSGLFDYAQGNDTFANHVVADPQHRWTRTEQLAGAMNWGDPQGAPGDHYHYSDTGYILLGEIIESKTGLNLGAAMRSLLNYEKLGLDETWLESIENKPMESAPRTHQYYSGFDTYTWDASMDLYGGGGLAASTEDVARFYHQLFNGHVYKSSNTIALMLQQMPKSSVQTNNIDVPAVYFAREGPDFYRFGIEVIPALDQEIYFHSGFWGIYAAYIPEWETAIVINVTNGSSGAYLLKHAMLIVEAYHKSV